MITRWSGRRRTRGVPSERPNGEPLCLPNVNLIETEINNTQTPFPALVYIRVSEKEEDTQLVIRSRETARESEKRLLPYRNDEHYCARDCGVLQRPDLGSLADLHAAERATRPPSGKK